VIPAGGPGAGDEKVWLSSLRSSWVRRILTTSGSTKGAVVSKAVEQAFGTLPARLCTGSPMPVQRKWY